MLLTRFSARLLRLSNNAEAATFDDVVHEYAAQLASKGSAIERAMTRNVGATPAIHEKGPPFGGPSIVGSGDSLFGCRLNRRRWREHQRAGRIGQWADDVERRTRAIGLLQCPVAHVQLQAEQHAMVGNTGVGE